MGHMYDNIQSGKYDNKLPYVPHKKDPEAYKAYCTEAASLINLFQDDLEKEYLPENLKGKEKIFDYAWQEGHGFGLNDVLNIYLDLAALIVKVMLANIPEVK